MSSNEFDNTEMTKWDPGFVGVADRLIKPAMRLYFRAEVRGLDLMPPTGGALMVCNHSGGVLTPDVLVLAPAFYEKFGLDRPLYTLAHYGVFFTPLVEWLRRFGVVHANPDNAAKALHSGGVVIVFPGGDYDAFRPTRRRNVIDFEGRTGYVRAAIEAGVPIVPVVSIGAQEMQWFLTRGAGMARRLGLHRIRMDILPLTFGFPFGLTTVFPANMPLPTKIVTEVLEPIDIASRYGEHPDVDEVDADVRMVMQRALDRLAGQRRFPVLG